MKFRSITTITVIILFLGLFVLASGVSAQERTKNAFYSIRFGIYGGGDVTVKHDNSEVTFNSESGVAFGIAYDKLTSGKLVPGFAFDMVQLKYPGESSMAFHFTGTLKYDISNKQAAWRPGLGLGLGLANKVGYVDNSIHFSARLINDIVVNIDPRMAFVIEFGFLYDIYGNGGEYDIHGGPFPTIRGGLMF